MAVAGHSGGKVERAVAKVHPWLEWMARFGYVAKGFVYMVIGGLALWAAVNHHQISPSDQTTNQKGVLNYLGEQPFGQAILIATGVGLAGYALWRLISTIFNPDDQSVWKRIGYAASGIGYGYLAFLAIQASQGQHLNADDHATANSLMHQPFGRFLMIAAGIVMLAFAIGQLWIAATTGFKSVFKLNEMPRSHAVAAIWLGRIGLTARSALFGLVGGFMLAGGLAQSVQKAGGFNRAFRTVQSSPGGDVLLGVLCLGLLCYGVFMLFEAAYRHIKTADPQVVREEQGHDDD